MNSYVGAPGALLFFLGLVWCGVVRCGAVRCGLGRSVRGVCFWDFWGGFGGELGGNLGELGVNLGKLG